MPGVIRDPRPNNNGGPPVEHRYGILFVYAEDTLLNENDVPMLPGGGALMAYDKINGEGKINSFRRELMANDLVVVGPPITAMPEGADIYFEGHRITHIIDLPGDDYKEPPGQASMNKKMLMNRILHGIKRLEDQAPNFEP